MRHSLCHIGDGLLSPFWVVELEPRPILYNEHVQLRFNSYWQEVHSDDQFGQDSSHRQRSIDIVYTKVYIIQLWDYTLSSLASSSLILLLKLQDSKLIVEFWWKPLSSEYTGSAYRSGWSQVRFWFVIPFVASVPLRVRTVPLRDTSISSFKYVSCCSS